MYVSLKLPHPSKTLAEKIWPDPWNKSVTYISQTLTSLSNSYRENLPRSIDVARGLSSAPSRCGPQPQVRWPAARDEMEGRMRYMAVYLLGSQALISPVDMSMNLWPWHVSVLETNLCLGLIELQVARFSFSSLTILG